MSGLLGVYHLFVKLLGSCAASFSDRVEEGVWEVISAPIFQKSSDFTCVVAALRRQHCVARFTSRLVRTSRLPCLALGRFGRLFVCRNMFSVMCRYLCVYILCMYRRVNVESFFYVAFCVH